MKQKEANDIKKQLQEIEDRLGREFRASLSAIAEQLRDEEVNFTQALTIIEATCTHYRQQANLRKQEALQNIFRL